MQSGGERSQGSGMSGQEAKRTWDVTEAGTESMHNSMVAVPPGNAATDD